MKSLSHLSHVYLDQSIVNVSSIICFGLSSINANRVLDPEKAVQAFTPTLASTGVAFIVFLTYQSLRKDIKDIRKDIKDSTGKVDKDVGELDAKVGELGAKVDHGFKKVGEDMAKGFNDMK